MSNNDDLFLEQRFRSQVDAALVTVKRILDTSRCPRYAAEAEDHSYEDKYQLAEWLTVMAMSSACNALERIGLSPEKLSSLCKLYQESSKTITLRFVSVETCDFEKEKVVTVDSPHEESLEVSIGGSSLLSRAVSFRRKAHYKATEYHWKVGVEYKIFVFLGNDPTDDPLELYQASREATLLTRGSKEAPLEARNVCPDLDVEITWLIRRLATNEAKSSSFSIDRSSEKCRTPRRNDDIDTAFQSFFVPLSRWCDSVLHYFTESIEGEICGRNMESLGATPPQQTYSLESVTTESLFIPVLPLMENQEQQVATADLLQLTNPSLRAEETVEDHPGESMVLVNTASSSFLLPDADAENFLREQCRALDKALQSHHETFPASTSTSSPAEASSKREKSKKGNDTTSHLITVDEANLALILRHVMELCRQYTDSVGYIEDMLRTQLLKAIGKEIGPSDFEDYVRFHNQKWFVPDFAPQPFSYAIRRPHHYPDGIISIEEKAQGVVTSSFSPSSRPITTFRRNVSADLPPMKIPINAATSIALEGQAYLHGWMLQTFRNNDENKRKFQLIARARQFSCFLLMVGSISGPNVFDPKDAIILQNKDEVLVPLLLEQLPSAKEFRDAISSLSPEQQRFAKAFRTMQLESSVFGVCVVQLKPQLETLLRLPSNALTKEIRLTQDLLSLFIDYQIPSDLLSFDGDDTGAEVSTSSKLEAVRGHVAAVMGVIDKAKEDELREAEREADMKRERDGLGCDSDSVDERLLDEFDQYKAQTLNECAMNVGSAAECFTLSSSSPSLPPPSRRLHSHPKIPRFHGVTKMRHTTFSSTTSAHQLRGLRRAGAAPVRAKAPAPPLTQRRTDVGEDAPTLPATKERANDQQESNSVFENAMENGNPEDVHASDNSTMDLTQVPKTLDAALGACEDASAVRSTIIKTADLWTKMSLRNLVLNHNLKEESLNSGSLKTERNKAFDLLDALSRSGSLALRDCELHVVIAATHCFGNGLVETVVQDNVNPIEKMEQSTLLLASTIHAETPPENMVRSM